MNLFELPLFTFEMANNHQGSVEHGKRIIRAMREAAEPFFDRFRFAVKFQYRDLDTFIHPAARGREDVKHVKRFEQTRLTREQFKELRDCISENGMLTMCTPFDEPSAARIKEEGFDIIKIASCSFADWPLMEAMAATGLPVIASAAGSDVETITNVVSFFGNRRIPLALMHCVGEYPTPNEHLQMNQIDYYRKAFPDLTIGFSTHEAPDNMEPVKIAVAKGARIFEKHVGVPSDEITLNGYSANPDQVRAWIEAADAAFVLCGEPDARYVPTEKEAADLASLRRGAFIKADSLEKGTVLGEENVYFAFPCQPGQLIAQDFSKYARYVLDQPLPKDAPVMGSDIAPAENMRPLVERYVTAVTDLLNAANAVVPVNSECHLSHHYGIEKFEETGIALIDCVNREYCKKLLVLLPGQDHPVHSHIKKEETFIILHGDLTVINGDSSKIITRGETLTIERGTPHAFATENGCVFEEISSTHFNDDSCYDKQDEFVSPRKTKVYLTEAILCPA